MVLEQAEVLARNVRPQAGRGVVSSFVILGKEVKNPVLPHRALKTKSKLQKPLRQAEPFPPRASARGIQGVFHEVVRPAQQGGSKRSSGRNVVIKKQKRTQYIDYSSTYWTFFAMK
jgi:hypothetical protein